MRQEEHERESMAKFGNPFSMVHRWLDEFAGTLEYGMRHRRVRHHLAGIEQARALFGDTAAEAARAHVVSDLRQEGWSEADRFPRDEADYVRMGLF